MVHSPILHLPSRALLAAVLCGAAASLAALSAPHALGGGKGKNSADEVKITPTASRPDAAGNQVITLNIDINKGWYIYANPVDNEDFEGNHTLVTVTGKVKPAAVKVEYPPGTQHRLGTFAYKIYEGKVAIRALVQRAPGDTGPLDVRVQVNTCSKEKGLCLPTGTVKLSVP